MGVLGSGPVCFSPGRGAVRIVALFPYLSGVPTKLLSSYFGEPLSELLSRVPFCCSKSIYGELGVAQPS